MPRAPRAWGSRWRLAGDHTWVVGGAGVPALSFLPGTQAALSQHHTGSGRAAGIARPWDLLSDTGCPKGHGRCVVPSTIPGRTEGGSHRDGATLCLGNGTWVEAEGLQPRLQRLTCGPVPQDLSPSGLGRLGRPRRAGVGPAGFQDSEVFGAGWGEEKGKALLRPILWPG